MLTLFISTGVNISTSIGVSRWSISKEPNFNKTLNFYLKLIFSMFDKVG